MALGIAVGSVLRRVLPSLATTLAIFVALRVAIGVYLRPHYMAPITKLFAPSGRPAPARRLDPLDQVRDSRGQYLGAGFAFSKSPRPAAPPPGGKGLHGQCLASHGFHQMITYQPASRFWAFQGIEAGIFVLLARALVGFAIWWVLGRDA